MVAQKPYPIRGTVTVAAGPGGTATAQQGVMVWIRDLTEGTKKYDTNSFHYYRTNSSGQYLIDLANITSAYANSDTVRVYIDTGHFVYYTDTTVDLRAGSSVVNFTITRRSGLIDGLNDTKSSDGTGGFKEHSLRRGLRPGLTDAMK